MRQTLDKIASQTLKFILPLTAFLVPLFFLTLTPDFFSFNKRFLLYILASVSLIAFSIRTLTRRKLQLTLSPASGPLLALVAIYIISSIVQAPNTTQSLFGQTSLIAALVVIFLTTTSSQKNQFVIQTTIYSLLASVFITSLFAIYQALGLAENMAGPAYLQSKIFNPAGGPLPLLSLTLPLIPAVIYLGLKTNQWLAKLFIFTVATVFTVASIFQINFLLPSTPEASLTLLPLSAGWSIAVDIFKNARTALLGTGPGTFLTAFTRLRPISLNFTPLWNIRFSNSSNELLTILTTTGLLGLLSFIFSFTRTSSAAGAKTLLGVNEVNYPTGAHHTFSRIILITSFIVFFLVPATPVLLTLSFLALTLVTLNLKLQDHNKVKDVIINLVATPKSSAAGAQTPLDASEVNYPTGDNTVNYPTGGANAILPWAYTTFTVILLGFFWFFSGRIYAAAAVTKKAIDTLNTEAITSYNYQSQAYTLDPTNPAYRINFSQTSLALANSLAQNENLSDQDKQDLTQLVEQAIREAKNATQLDPRNVTVWENLASTYRQIINFAEGAADWTIAAYSQAINLDPTNPALRLDLGGVLLTLKDYDGAISLFQQAVDRKSDWPNAHYNLSAAYRDNKNYPKALAEMRIVVQLLDPNTDDYQKAQDELTALEKLVPAAQVSPGVGPDSPGVAETEKDIQLVTPTPLPSPAEPINLPEDSAPEIPSPTPTEEPESTEQSTN
ncbi:tetratricopeptide repeat protein [Patescibacteria group bacterium]|nr:tetratricopeptide repeat protein [Patescibacteria group bacterium]MBU1256154.1 tetratricopeptide repeat protein [Patescibacteria group bacterium]MBU1457904.1 tetratricopeptide repeat protein [Patescibacteria group bacterium]